MFDIEGPGSAPGSTIPVPDAPVPLERLEAQTCELAGHLAAATCRFLVLLADFDARRGWASWEMSSCAAWLSWKCQMSSGAAREHVRVARALRDLPVIRGEFGAARLSYAKVRALTRIATPDNEGGLAEIAGPMTGNQLERFARAHRRVSHADDATAQIRRRLTWRLEDDGSLAGTFRLPPLQGAVLLKALRAAAGDLDHPHDGEDGSVSAETPAISAASPVVVMAWVPTCTMTWYTSGSSAAATFPARNASAITNSASARLEEVATAGLSNLISLCKYHHMLVHDRGYLIAAHPGGAFTFFRPDGTGIPPSPALPPPDGTIGDCHDAQITHETIIPPWYGERLDLDHAIYTCLANARTPQERQERQEQRDQADDPELFRPRVWLVEPADWIRHITEHTAA